LLLGAAKSDFPLSVPWSTAIMKGDMRRNAAAHINPLDLPECVIRENGRELQGLIECGRDAGGLKVIENECHAAL
jgi:hypothetical protein